MADSQKNTKGLIYTSIHGDTNIVETSRGEKKKHEKTIKLSIEVNYKSEEKKLYFSLY